MGVFTNLKSAFASKTNAVNQPPKTEYVNPVNCPDAKKTNHRITGVSHYEKNIMKFAMKNNAYNLSSKEIIAAKLYDRNIYEYFFPAQRIELIPEPTNEHDPNAIKVMFGGVHVGYIKAGSCARILKLIESNSIQRIEGSISGGCYKYYWHDGISLQTEKGKSKFNIEIAIIEK